MISQNRLKILKNKKFIALNLLTGGAMGSAGEKQPLLTK